ncbi:MAG: right-handed parallel beta-helix repeat-containing protein [Alloprevotella sp.]|nr:right-handed parallel beta-helix repeat-containing protein [Alloprevotella sp.]
MKRLLYTLFAALALVSCMDDEDFAVDASTRLTIRRDTVSLGAVIYDETATTDTLKVFNENAAGLRIRRVWLEGGADSPFRVNMDGVFLADGAAEDFEVLARDSLFAFLSFHAPGVGDADSLVVTDRLHFLTEGGVDQSVVLTATSLGAVKFYGSVLTEDEVVFDAARPYQIFDSLVVSRNTTLTLRAGTRLLFHPGAELIVHGRLIAEGTPERNVSLQGDRLGNMLSQIPYDRVPGQWGGVHFTEHSYGNVLHYTDIHSGQYGIRLDSCDMEQMKLQMEGCLVHNSGADGIYARSCRTSVSNSQISNHAGHCLNLYGGHHTFLHCTVAQFYPLVGGYGVALNFTNHDEFIRLPLEQALFENCIITGRNADDIMGEQSKRYRDCAFNYAFSHCLLNTPRVDDISGEEHFTACLWEEDDKEHRGASNFAEEFDYDKLTFHFELDSLSQAVGTASLPLARTLPTDRFGRSRLADSAPDMGCYERQPRREEE